MRVLYPAIVVLGLRASTCAVLRAWHLIVRVYVVELSVLT